MTRGSLPNQIVLLALAALIAVLATLWISLYTVREAMNAEAAKESERLMGGRLRSLQEQVSLIASDYHNWTDLFLDAKNLDYERLASNYGITAERGDVFQYAELFRGPFPKPVGWREGQGLAPQEGIIDRATKLALRDRVRNLDVNGRQTVDYMQLHDGMLVMFSSSYLLPEAGILLADLDPDDQAIAVIGKVLSEERLTKIADEFSMRDIRVVETSPGLGPGTVNLPAIDVSGEPVAWLEWHPPTPGTVLFQKIAPIMYVVSFVFVGGFYWCAKVLRNNATKIIVQEAKSFDQARTDALTALPNRFALREHLKRVNANGALDCAIVAMDLDRFKQINETVGHIGGDLFLEAFGARLRGLSDDETFVARLGGDEFVLVISSNGSLEEVLSRKCAGLDEITREPVSCNGVRFDVMVSKGVAKLHAGQPRDDELLRRADRALYTAKMRGTQKAIFYDDQMECEDREHMAIESWLRSALIDGEGFSIVYQPIVAAADDCEEMRFEALARWCYRDAGEVPPDKFIQVAEARGLIVRLGWLLLDLICRDIRGMERCKIGVNVSPLQLMTPGFGDLFAARVEANGIQPKQIEVEVTEQIVVRDDVTIVQELNVLRERGFSLALDDFGTGYSSIGYLTRMPFDVLKIDRSFARLQADNVQHQRMVRSMVGLAHAMDLKIIAEGIETPEEALRFRALGSDFLQGYYFGPPAPLRKRELESTAVSA
ncbi:Cyclic di-GMP phosphodiesterase Gmr [Jannaschia seosinensis]|uniref:Cyclic di-GMP phosphodiesterase Gmr n=1 Tax=Jannaschia seosinensis TaxID=313367 RepID=A0A0M7B6K8_9RHOB|nr:bifunctional diguanylate cyclase/phosphodiesterase [Jannaschia seosinensis]CUH09955.1 Cyclic di-GMP phosphodiesterase Gmr [Jannaschia seosinensis]